MNREKLVTEFGYQIKINELTAELTQASDKIVELVNEIGQLKTALRPFAKEATHWVNYRDEEPVVEAFPGYEGEITVGDLRLAYVTMMGLVKEYKQAKKDIEEMKNG